MSTPTHVGYPMTKSWSRNLCDDADTTPDETLPLGDAREAYRNTGTVPVDCGRCVRRVRVTLS